MDGSIYQRLHPHTYLQRFLERGVRTDGRKEGDWRSVGVNVGESLVVRLLFLSFLLLSLCPFHSETIPHNSYPCCFPPTALQTYSCKMSTSWISTDCLGLQGR
jgi:hypothetical protein